MKEVDVVKKLERKIKVISSAAFVLSITLILCFGTSYAVDSLPKQSYLPLDMAQKAANAALKKCTDDGYRISVTIVDRSGVSRVVLRADGAGPHTINSSLRKAYTAASMGQSTQDLANLIKDKPELQGLRNMDNQILILAGGLPIKVGDETVGGIGVGGAPGGHLDEICAKAGVDSIVGKP